MAQLIEITVDATDFRRASAMFLVAAQGIPLDIALLMPQAAKDVALRLALASPSQERRDPRYDRKLRESWITLARGDGEWWVVSTEPKKLYWSVFGTAPHRIFPTLKRAVFWPGAAGPIASVRHPGSPGSPWIAPVVASYSATGMPVIAQRIGQSAVARALGGMMPTKTNLFNPLAGMP